MSRWWKAPGHKLESESWARGACSLTGERCKDTRKAGEGSARPLFKQPRMNAKAPLVLDQRGFRMAPVDQPFLLASSISLMPPTLLSTPVAS
jgi:hypothetical protein